MAQLGATKRALRPFQADCSGSLDLPTVRHHSRQTESGPIMSDSPPRDTPNPLENPEQIEREGLEITERDIVFDWDWAWDANRAIAEDDCEQRDESAAGRDLESLLAGVFG